MSLINECMRERFTYNAEYHVRGNSLLVLFARCTGFVIFCPLFAGDHSCNPLVKVNQVLCIFSAFVFVLQRDDMNMTTRRERQVIVKPTVVKSKGLAHPRSTCASFHAETIINARPATHGDAYQDCGYHSCWHSYPDLKTKE